MRAFVPPQAGADLPQFANVPYSTSDDELLVRVRRQPFRWPATPFSRALRALGPA